MVSKAHVGTKFWPVAWCSRYPFSTSIIFSETSLNKAHNTVDFLFMFQMMEGLIFLGKFICMTNLVFHEVGLELMLMENQLGNFKPTRGFVEVAP
jgi:hypothetical protein